MKSRSNMMVLVVMTLLMIAPLAGIVTSTLADETVPPAVSDDMRQRVLDSVIKGLEWYATIQNTDGSWRASAGITAFVVLCFTGAGYDYTNVTVSKALTYIRQFYNPIEGSVEDIYQNYVTALSLMAFAAAGDPEDADRIPKMVDFMEHLQYSESSKFPIEKPWYPGGWPNYAGKPDLSNQQFALLGLQTAELLTEGIQVSDQVWANSTEFVNRCQNWADVNEMEWAHNITLPSHNDGGFSYNPNRSRTELGEQMFESYGSISAAGYYSYMVAGLDEGRPEVAAAREWLDFEYNLEANPRMVGKGLYYYLWTQARALAMSGQDWVVDSAGKLRDWRAEVADLFMDRQYANGGWPGNPQNGWREEEPEVMGLYAILSMQAAYMTTPNSELTIDALDTGPVLFTDLYGKELLSDPSRGLTVTDASFTCTDPETFRKVWVQVADGPGGPGALSIEGTWGDGRTSRRTVSLGDGDPNVLVTTGGFAGPFGIHATVYDGGPKFEVDKKRLELVRGETEITDFKLTETSGKGPITRAILITDAGEGVVGDVDVQGIDVPAGDVDVLRLTISIVEDAKTEEDWSLIITSSTAPSKVIPLKVVDSRDSDVVIGLWYWLVIVMLVVIVFFFLLLPQMAKRRAEETEFVHEAEEADDEEPVPPPTPEREDSGPE